MNKLKEQSKAENNEKTINKIVYVLVSYQIIITTTRKKIQHVVL